MKTSLIALLYGQYALADHAPSLPPVTRTDAVC